MSALWTEILLSQGFCIIPGLLSETSITELERDLDPIFQATPFCEGNFYGFRTKRFGSLLRRSRHAATLAMEPTVYRLAQDILGPFCDRFQLNVAQAIEIHPGEVQQFAHRDQDMWAGAKGDHEYLLNVIWPLTPFTKANGATRIHPLSHGRHAIEETEIPEAVIAECQPGDAICFLGSTAHGAGANLTQEVRRAVVIGYSLGWLKPYENLWLAYPPEVARHFSPELAALAGYRQHRPNLGNFEGQCPSVLLDGNVPQHLAAIDALRPDQQAMLEQYASAMRG